MTDYEVRILEHLNRKVNTLNSREVIAATLGIPLPDFDESLKALKGYVYFQEGIWKINNQGELKWGEIKIRMDNQEKRFMDLVKREFTPLDKIRDELSLSENDAIEMMTKLSNAGLIREEKDEFGDPHFRVALPIKPITPQSTIVVHGNIGNINQSLEGGNIKSKTNLMSKPAKASISKEIINWFLVVFGALLVAFLVYLFGWN